MVSTEQQGERLSIVAAGQQLLHRFLTEDVCESDQPTIPDRLNMLELIYQPKGVLTAYAGVIRRSVSCKHLLSAATIVG